MTTQGLHLDDPARYRIYTQGRFDVDWLDLLSGSWVIHRQSPGDSGITILTGNVADQAALLGVLQQLYCLGFPLLLVEHLTDQDSIVGDSAGDTRPLSVHLRLVCAGLLWLLHAGRACEGQQCGFTDLETLLLVLRAELVDLQAKTIPPEELEKKHGPPIEDFAGQARADPGSEGAAQQHFADSPEFGTCGAMRKGLI